MTLKEGATGTRLRVKKNEAAQDDGAASGSSWYD